MRLIHLLSILLLAGSALAAIIADPCVNDPTQPNCADYTLPDATVTSDLTHLCNMMPNMPGCGLWTVCKANQGLQPAKYCDNFSILKLICADGMSGMGGCANWKSMCKQGSVVKECDMETLNLPGYTQVKSDVQAICADMPGMTGCTNCTAAISKCDLINEYSILCNEMPDMGQCGAWKVFCVNVPSWAWCSNAPIPPPTASQPPQGSIDCVKSPATPSCSSFELPPAVIQENTAILCKSMPSMPGCAINATCAASTSLQSSPYCAAFSIYKTLCTDMPTMTGCGNYTSMCAAGSVINQCNVPAAPVPTTMKTFNLIKSICTEPGMLMEPCYKCQGKQGPGTGMNCDLLEVYSDLCVEMPGMAQCGMWDSFCKVMGDWPFCTGTTTDGQTQPVMRMWFHASISDYVLFYGWVPQNALSYTGTWFAILFFSIGYEFLKFLRSRLEMKFTDMVEDYKWDEPQDPQPLNDTDSERPVSPPTAIVKGACISGPRWYFSVDVPRGLFQMLEVSWSLLLMLVAMTYNIGLFLAIPAGAFIGTVLFGRYIAYKPAASCH